MLKRGGDRVRKDRKTIDEPDYLGEEDGEAEAWEWITRAAITIVALAIPILIITAVLLLWSGGGQTAKKSENAFTEQQESQTSLRKETGENEDNTVEEAAEVEIAEPSSEPAEAGLIKICSPEDDRVLGTYRYAGYDGAEAFLQKDMAWNSQVFRILGDPETGCRLQLSSNGKVLSFSRDETSDKTIVCFTEDTGARELQWIIRQNGDLARIISSDGRYLTGTAEGDMELSEEKNEGWRILEAGAAQAVSGVYEKNEAVGSLSGTYRIMSAADGTCLYSTQQEDGSMSVHLAQKDDTHEPAKFNFSFRTDHYEISLSGTQLYLSAANAQQLTAGVQLTAAAQFTADAPFAGDQQQEEEGQKWMVYYRGKNKFALVSEGGAVTVMENREPGMSEDRGDITQQWILQKIDEEAEGPAGEEK